MDSASQYKEGALVKTKIVATVGPASGSREKLAELLSAGVDVVRLNFAHGNYEWFAQIVEWIRSLSQEIGRPIGILGDLSGPKKGYVCVMEPRLNSCAPPWTLART
jgi:pyruvate kinase